MPHLRGLFKPNDQTPALNKTSAPYIVNQQDGDVVQSRQDGGFYPTHGRVAQNERDKERDEETERGVY
jgi:hypothetical protein